MDKFTLSSVSGEPLMDVRSSARVRRDEGPHNLVVRSKPLMSGTPISASSAARLAVLRDALQPQIFVSSTQPTRSKSLTPISDKSATMSASIPSSPMGNSHSTSSVRRSLTRSAEPSKLKHTSQQQLIHSPLEGDWKRRSVEVIPDYMYFSETDLSHLKMKKTLGEKQMHYLELTKYDLIEPTWAQSTEYFGPLCIEHLRRWEHVFTSYHPTKSTQTFCFYIKRNDYRTTNLDPRRKEKMLANAVILITTSLVLFCRMNPDRVVDPFLKRYKQFIGFGGTDGLRRGVRVEHCMSGLWKAIQFGLIKNVPVDEKANMLDFSWVIDGKIAACCTPSNASLPAYISYFVNHGVSAVVRLNDCLYEKGPLIKSNIHHLDLPFFDGGVPSSDTVQAFLQFVESREGATVVHCRGGIGRTGTLICCYIMKHYGMTAEEAIGYVRLRRPGAVNCTQQKYLEDLQSNIWKMAQNTQSSKLPGPFMDSVLCSKFDSILRGMGVTFDVDNMDSLVVFSPRQFKTFFLEVRRRVLFPTATRLPFRLPDTSSRIKMDSKQRLVVTLEDLTYLVDNIMSGCRLDVLDDFADVRDSQTRIFG
ncbi:cell division cycle 14 protein [Planoprotostelium fungivorum]|uniref:protein-tyrosine-phosphatase n=1 Tax=Planoprotostelium fungivorum TaxID=1890364 RepID=A0A2P6MPB6_9EUKA|nr:cell division cycle 14 protein [Planoprotostelium fungivorum]